MLGCFNLSMLLTLLALFLLHDFSFFFLLAILPHKLFQVFCRSRSRRSPCGVGLQGLPCDGLWSYGFFATWKRTIVLWVLVLMTELENLLRSYCYMWVCTACFIVFVKQVHQPIKDWHVMGKKILWISTFLQHFLIRLG